MATRFYAFVAYLSSKDEKFVKDMLNGSDYRFCRDAKGICALSFGHAKCSHQFIDELESDLIAMGLGVESCNMYWG